MSYVGSKILTQAMMAQYKKQCQEVDGLIPLLFDTLRKIEDDFYAPAYIDCIMQSYDERFDLFDAWVFLNCHALIYSGAVGVFAARVGAAPCRNYAVEGNNRALAQLQYPFTSVFHGDAGSDDGAFWWSKPINVAFVNIKRGWSGYRIAPAMSGTTTFFEVGSNAGVKMLSCFMREMEIVRWPYGSEYCFGFIPRSLTLGVGAVGFKEALRDAAVNVETEPLFQPNPFDLFWQASYKRALGPRWMPKAA